MLMNFLLILLVVLMVLLAFLLLITILTLIAVYNSPVNPEDDVCSLCGGFGTVFPEDEDPEECPHCFGQGVQPFTIMGKIRRLFKGGRTNG